ncbi:hypothetical protein ABK040_012565 [Willaertia magna]
MSATTNQWARLSGSQISTNLKLPSGEYGRRTKIVATIGPKTQSVEMLTKLIKAGVNVIRMNFSHGSHEFHKQTVVNSRIAAAQCDTIVAIMLDTKGPEIRTGYLEEQYNPDGIEIKTNQTIIFHCCQSKEEYESKKGKIDEFNNVHIYIDYSNMYKVLNVNHHILVDDGLIACQVVQINNDNNNNNEIKCKALNGGFIGEKKGCNLPGVKVDLPALTEKDKEDLKFGVQNNVDFIAASFIRKGQDVLEIRKVLGNRGQDIKIISKIENQEGLENFDEILQVSDGIMVARGDMGVEIPLEQVTLAQKMIIAKCNILGKPVITATQMLESMIKNPRPTRAEVTDIANAVYDGTDATMLSGETAKGDYPIEAVQTMSRVCVTSEYLVDERKTFNYIREAVLELAGKITVSETIASSAVKTANDIQAGLIITITETGNTARLVAKYRPSPPIIAVTQNKSSARQLMVSRNVFPVVVGSVIGTETVIARTIESAKEKKYVEEGQYVVVTSGHIEGVAGQTNILKVFTA